MVEEFRKLEMRAHRFFHHFSARGNVTQSTEENQAIPDVRELPPDPFFRGLLNRILHLGARFGPGSGAMRVRRPPPWTGPEENGAWWTCVRPD